jgi:hypothetical protein
MLHVHGFLVLGLAPAAGVGRGALTFALLTMETMVLPLLQLPLDAF